MSQFPLYNTLISNIPEKDLTVIQKNTFAKKIASLDTETHELIYALIKCYFIEENKGDDFCVPYNGTLSKDKIEYSLLDFPVKLRQLLFKFVNIHSKKLIKSQRKESSKNINNMNNNNNNNKFK